jgi:hypothetical protein
VKEREWVHLIDLPAFGRRTTTLRWLKVRWECTVSSCLVRSWTWVHTRIAAAHRNALRNPGQNWIDGAVELDLANKIGQIAGDKQGRSLTSNFLTGNGRDYARYNDKLWTNYLRDVLKRDDVFASNVYNYVAKRLLEGPDDVATVEFSNELFFPDSHQRKLFGDFLLNGVTIKVRGQKVKRSNSTEILLNVFVLDRFDARGAVESAGTDLVKQVLPSAREFNINIGYDRTIKLPANAQPSSDTARSFRSGL